MALREVNLVPEEILRRKLVFRHLLFWGICFAAVLSCIFGFRAYQAGVAMAQRPPAVKISDIDKQASLQIAEIKQIQEELDVIQRQLSELQAVVRPPVFARLLFELTEAVTPHTWLDTLQLERRKGSKDDTEEIVLKLKGYAASNGELGGFLNRLSAAPAFDRVALKYSREQSTETLAEAKRKTGPTIQFEIECAMVQG